MRNALFIILALFLFSCGSQETSNEKKETQKPIVTAVNYPLIYFAERIAGDYIQLELPIPADVDPAYWVPDEKALEVYQSADLILANGADYAKWMNNVSLPASRIVNTSATLDIKYIELKDVATHSHGPEGEHEHTGFAFTTWLDFELAAEQAANVSSSIKKKLPDHSELIEKNFQSLKSDLLSLDDQMKQLTVKIGDQHIIGSHPVYQYLSQAYALKIHSVHFEPDEMPSDEQWKELEHLLDHYPSVIMLWEDEPMPEVKNNLAEMGLAVVVFNPCGNRPGSGDFMEVMNQNISALQKQE